MSPRGAGRCLGGSGNRSAPRPTPPGPPDSVSLAFADASWSFLVLARRVAPVSPAGPCSHLNCLLCQPREQTLEGSGAEGLTSDRVDGHGTQSTGVGVQREDARPGRWVCAVAAFNGCRLRNENSVIPLIVFVLETALPRVRGEGVGSRFCTPGSGALTSAPPWLSSGGVAPGAPPPTCGHACAPSWC